MMLCVRDFEECTSHERLCRVVKPWERVWCILTGIVVSAVDSCRPSTTFCVVLCCVVLCCAYVDLFILFISPPPKTSAVVFTTASIVYRFFHWKYFCTYSDKMPGILLILNCGCFFLNLVLWRDAFSSLLPMSSLIIFTGAEWAGSGRRFWPARPGGGVRLKLAREGEQNGKEGPAGSNKTKQKSWHTKTKNKKMK